MRLRTAGPWLLLLAVVAGALAAGAGRGGEPSDEDRIGAIAAEVRCPTCQGLSAAESSAPAARAVRDFIAEQVAAGRTDGQIKAALAARYGTDILLRPEAGGVAGLVWVLPVVAVSLGIAGLAFTFRRWQRRSRLHATDEDRRLVDEAMRS
jgi:cytochrome c-type biogenesis protein CcmH